MTVKFLHMAEPLHIPETRFITDAEREELRALYAEAEALAGSDGEAARKNARRRRLQNARNVIINPVSESRTRIGRRPPP
jgi:hypothetical protein